MAANDHTDSANVPTSDDQLPPPEPAHPDRLTAKCHCGRINIEIPSLPTLINECRCSICYRYGAQWAYYHPDDVNIIVNAQGSRRAQGDSDAQQEPQTAAGGERDKGLQYYVRGDGKYLGFYYCGNCACLTHWAATPEGVVFLENLGKDKKMGVNTRMLPLNLFEGVERKTGPFCDLSDWN